MGFRNDLSGPEQNRRAMKAPKIEMCPHLAIERQETPFPRFGLGQ
jgi:hypothetical protein